MVVEDVIFLFDIFKKLNVIQIIFATEFHREAPKIIVLKDFRSLKNELNCHEF